MKNFLTFAFLLFNLSVWAQVPVNRPIIVEDTEAHLTPGEKEALRLKREKYRLNKIGVTINTPKKYTAYQGEIPSYCYSSSMNYAFVKNDSSVVVGISLMGRDSLDYLRSVEVNKLVPPFIENYDPDDQWIINFKGRADSTDFKPVFYSGKDLKKYNADGGIEFYRIPCADLFLDDYEIKRVVILNKKYRGIIEISYFVRQGAKVDIAKETKNGIKRNSWGGEQNHAYIFDNLNRKNFTSLTPLEVALNAFTFALKDSAEALVLLLIKKFRIER